VSKLPQDYRKEQVEQLGFQRSASERERESWGNGAKACEIWRRFVGLQRGRRRKIHEDDVVREGLYFLWSFRVSFGDV
jgi:hypothetical protein